MATTRHATLTSLGILASLMILTRLETWSTSKELKAARGMLLREGYCDHNPTTGQKSQDNFEGTSGKKFKMRRTRNSTNLQVLSQSQSFKPDEARTYPRCKLWTVITSINPPTTAVRQLAEKDNMCVCVVADLKSPPEYRTNNVVYLTPELQEALPYKSIKHLPWNHFGRKNLGYLFAMHYGARAIYDTDDDNEIMEGVFELPYTQHDMVRRYLKYSDSTNASTLNVYPHFGAPHSWPRGYPMDEIRYSTNASVSIMMGQSKSLGVIQSLANHDPDVDAIYRMSPLPLPFSFHENKELIGLEPHGPLCPYNAQATLHFERAFWAMLLPVSVHGRVSDIWRSYFAQRLFREVDIAISFTAPWVEQHRNAHDYLADFSAEGQLYERSAALVNYLTEEWSCGTDEIDLGACLVRLYLDMYEYGILEASDVKLVQAWVDDLNSLGYTFPVQTSVLAVKEFEIVGGPGGTLAIQLPKNISEYIHAAPCTTASTTITESIPTDTAVHTSNISWATPTELSLTVSDADFGIPAWYTLSCPTGSGNAVVTVDFIDPVLPLPIFEDILLVVNFNFGKEYGLHEELTRLYNASFPNIMFIGTDEPEESLRYPAGPIHHYTDIRHGWSMYRALEYAMKFDPGRRGYMLTNNDVAMRFWTWKQRDFDKVWAGPLMCSHALNTSANSSSWTYWHWPDEMRTHFLRNFIQNLDDRRRAQLFNTTGGPGMLYYQWSDFFYIPGALASAYLELLSSFRDDGLNELFEVLHPMLLQLVAPEYSWQPLNVLYCWDPDPESPRYKVTQCPSKFISEANLDVVHPWKLGAPTAAFSSPLYTMPGKKAWLGSGP